MVTNRMKTCLVPLIFVASLGGCGGASARHESHATTDVGGSAGSGGHSTQAGAGEQPGHGTTAPSGGDGGGAGAGAAGGQSANPDGGTAAAAGDGALTGGEGGAPTGAQPPVPSPGCALAITRKSGALELPEAPFPTRALVPSAYDGASPLPLLLFLHATNQIADYLNLRGDTAIAEQYLVVSPEGRRGSGLDSFESLASIEDLDDMLDDILANVCVDESRLFAVGNGSGGRALMGWLARRDKTGFPTRFRAVTVVGSYSGRVNWQPTPLLFLHPLYSANSSGVTNDADGMKAFTLFSAANTCGSATTPTSLASCQVSGMTVEPGCVDISDCAAPLRFCHFDGPDQSSSGDAWPCFGAAAIAKFFEPYRQ